jgi:hypothetical protein
MLEKVLFVAIVAERLVEYIFSPLVAMFVVPRFPDNPQVKEYAMRYAGLIFGGLLGWFMLGALLEDYFVNPIVARLLTAILIGGGSNLIHQVFAKKESS